MMKIFKPTFCTLSELKLREPEAECLEDDHDGYKSCAQTPDMRIGDVDARINWRPNGGSGVLYREEWADKLEKAKVTSRSVILLYNLDGFRFAFIGCYLPTNSNENSSFSRSLSEISNEILRLREKYKEKFAFCMNGDLNIDVKHADERKSIFEEFLRLVDGYHWVPSQPSFQHVYWQTIVSWMDMSSPTTLLLWTSRP